MHLGKGFRNLPLKIHSHAAKRKICALAEHKLLIHATMTNSTWKMACPARLSAVHTMNARGAEIFAWDALTYTAHSR